MIICDNTVPKKIHGAKFQLRKHMPLCRSLTKTFHGIFIVCLASFTMTIHHAKLVL